MDIQAKARDIIRYGEIIHVKDYVDNNDCYRIYYMATENNEFYKITMKNGKTIELKKI